MTDTEQNTATVRMSLTNRVEHRTKHILKRLHHAIHLRSPNQTKLKYFAQRCIQGWLILESKRNNHKSTIRDDELRNGSFSRRPSLWRAWRPMMLFLFGRSLYLFPKLNMWLCTSLYSPHITANMKATFITVDSHLPPSLMT